MTELFFNERVRPVALTLLERASMPANLTVAENRKNLLLNYLQGLNFAEVNGETVLLDADGFPARDQHYNSINLTAAITNAIDMFFDPHGLPLTRDEYNKQISDLKLTPDERTRIVEHWQKIYPQDFAPGAGEYHKK